MLPISRPAVSRHLNVLKRASLVVEMPQRAILETLLMVFDRRSTRMPGSARLAGTSGPQPSSMSNSLARRAGRAVALSARVSGSAAPPPSARQPRRAGPSRCGSGGSPAPGTAPGPRSAGGRPAGRSPRAPLRQRRDPLDRVGRHPRVERDQDHVRPRGREERGREARSRRPRTSTRVPGRSAPASRAAACSTATPNASNVSDCSRAVAVRTPRNGPSPPRRSRAPAAGAGSAERSAG